MTLPSKTMTKFKGSFIGVAVFSAVINILMLTGPLFMLQVYDRVLASRSSATLAVLFAIVVFLFAMMAFLDHYRGRALARVGAGFQTALDRPVFEAVLHQAQYLALRERPAAGLRDLATIQGVLSSPGMGAVFDLPWTPLFVGMLFLFHHWLGWFAVAGAVLILGLTTLNQLRTKRLQAEAARHVATADAQVESMRRSIETVRGLGMTQSLREQWEAAREVALRGAMDAADRGGAMSSGTKATRLLLQSAILGLGALLVLRGELTPGVMIVGSILLGRALAPIEQVIGHWAQFQRAMVAWKELGKLLEAKPHREVQTELPRPNAVLSVRNLSVAPPGESAPVLRDVSFLAEPGDAIAVLGPSASGKSTLARALAGLWPVTQGEIRLGGAELAQYDPDRLGRSLGYLPQDVAVFSGTVAHNIARFDPEARSEDVILAAEQAAAHELILGLADGYDTQVSEGGGRLSGGQRQRIGLARAFFGDPVCLILDEPNASLDDPGVQALNLAISNARAAGKVVLVMSHRPSALAECNKVMILEGGQMRAFGPRDEVLNRFVKPVQAVAGMGRGGAS
ncbi:protease/lipase ABC transporter permease/ATP-binding protein [Thioclava sp. DLFJ5-1]|nr:protease/lipase ABC transporter permease/ATP-binding protein [Thioclava sp. DLFJ5-1]